MGNIVETRPFVPWEQMNNFMVDAFKGYGVPEEDAKICADVLLESDRRGIESHGCNRFKPIYIDRIVKGTLLPVTEIEILKETPTTDTPQIDAPLETPDTPVPTGDKVNAMLVMLLFVVIIIVCLTSIASSDKSN